jgi:hypothetical protein
MRMSEIDIDANAEDAVLAPLRAPAPRKGSKRGTRVDKGASVKLPITWPRVSKKGAAQMAERLRAMKSTTDELAAIIKNAYQTRAKESADYGMQLIETMHASATSSCEFAATILTAENPTEVFEISNAHARKQLELVTEHTRRLWTMTQKFSVITAQKTKADVPKPKRKKRTKTDSISF